MSGIGLEALPDVSEWLGIPPGYLGVVRRPTRMSVSSLESLPDVREWSGGPPGFPRVVVRLSQIYGSGR